MPFQISCPSCARPLRLGEEYVGYLVRCPSCNHEFTANPETEADAGIRRDDSPPPAPRPDGGDLIQANEPPVAPPRPRRYDDEDDDEFDERPRRRRWPEADRQYAIDKVSGPANGLLAAGWIGVFLTVCGVGANFMQVVNENPGGGNNPGFMIDAASSVVSIPLAIASCVLVILGATRMKNLQSIGLAKAAAIIAMIPCVSPCCPLGIPFGIMAFQALGDPRVESAFREAARPRDYDDRT